MSDEDGRKRVGRPVSIGYKGQNVFTGKCDVRLTTEEDSALSRLAERNGVSRSEIMRKALKDFVRWNTNEDI